MKKLWRGIVSVIFWSYERGSWPYDVAVIAIVVFVLFAPRAWFHDQPAVGPQAHEALIELRSVAPGQISTYSVDARVLASPIRTPELEHELHEAMRKNVAELSHGGFQIKRIDPVRNADGTVAYYLVSVQP